MKRITALLVNTRTTEKEVHLLNFLHYSLSESSSRMRADSSLVYFGKSLCVGTLNFLSKKHMPSMRVKNVLGLRGDITAKNSS